VAERLTPDQLRAKLDRVATQLIPAVERGMRQATAVIEARAKSNCTPGESPYYKAPFDKGFLRGTIYTAVETHGHAVQGFVASPMEYAPPVHEGTSRMPARPFLLDAIITERESTISLLSAALAEEMEAAG
jgi:hypothetical protein